MLTLARSAEVGPANYRVARANGQSPSGNGQSTVDKLRVFYVPCPSSTREREVEALASVYAFILECHENRKATEKTDGDEDGEAAEHRRAEGIVPEKEEQ